MVRAPFEGIRHQGNVVLSTLWNSGLQNFQISFEILPHIIHILKIQFILKEEEINLLRIQIMSEIKLKIQMNGLKLI